MRCEPKFIMCVRKISGCFVGNDDHEEYMVDFEAKKREEEKRRAEEAEKEKKEMEQTEASHFKAGEGMLSLIWLRYNGHKCLKHGETR